MTSRDRLEAIWRDGVRAVHAGTATKRVLPSVVPQGSLCVLAMGKAAPPMAAAALAFAEGRIQAGLVITKDGHGGPLDRYASREAAHPVPDARSEAAAREALRFAADADAESTLLVLLSGGTSALTSCPAPGLEQADLIETTSLLLGCGADIGEMNAVRKHLSDFSGGRLALASTAARIEVLAVSDVPGDSLDVIGSGPCAPDPTTYADALTVLERRGIDARVPNAVLEHLRRGARGEVPETPKALENVRHELVATNADARAAAARAARERGLEAIDLGAVLDGEARDQARRLVARAREQPRSKPVCLIAGGETTVTLKGEGRGGRNQEFALAAACELTSEDSNVTLLAAGTDGTDGPTHAAGAFADAGTLSRGRDAGGDARRCLDENDATTFFEAEGGLFVTGPTGTNVMDLVLVELS